MKKEDFFDVLGDLDDNIVEGAKPTMKKSINWKIWGTMAACLCLIAGVVATSKISSPLPPMEGGSSPDGIWPEGADPIIASIAVYPANENVENIETATCEKLGKEEAYAMEVLGEHLPTWLPDSVSFDYANLYETTMKDGTKYYMLRAFYTTGKGIPSYIVDGETAQSFPDNFHDEFAVFVMNYKPVSQNSIHQIGDLPEFLGSTWGGDTFFFEFENVYIGFSPSRPEFSVDEILSVITSIK